MLEDSSGGSGSWRVREQAREDKVFSRALNVLAGELVKASKQDYVEDTFGGFSSEFALPYVHGLAFTLEDWSRYTLVMEFKHLVTGCRDLEGDDVDFWMPNVDCSEGRW